jgi:hypothetical protein
VGGTVGTGATKTELSSKFGATEPRRVPRWLPVRGVALASGTMRDMRLPREKQQPNGGHNCPQIGERSADGASWREAGGGRPHRPHAGMDLFFGMIVDDRPLDAAPYPELSQCHVVRKGAPTG